MYIYIHICICTRNMYIYNMCIRVYVYIYVHRYTYMCIYGCIVSEQWFWDVARNAGLVLAQDPTFYPCSFRRWQVDLSHFFFEHWTGLRGYFERASTSCWFVTSWNCWNLLKVWNTALDIWVFLALASTHTEVDKEFWMGCCARVLHRGDCPSSVECPMKSKYQLYQQMHEGP